MQPIPKELEENVIKIQGILKDIDLEYQAAADHRKTLERLVKAITEKEDDAKKALDASYLELNNLKKAYFDRENTYFMSEFPYLGKKWITWPILDAFNSPQKIDNLWSDGLTIDYNFAKVRRFDRCTTCHQSMEKAMPGAADKPLYVKEKLLDFTMATPDAKTAEAAEAVKLVGTEENADQKIERMLEDLYGIRLAPAGALRREDVTLSYVAPQSFGAKAEFVPTEADTTPVTGAELRNEALQTTDLQGDKFEAYPTRPGLMFGDVITKINDDFVRGTAEAQRLLLKTVQWGAPITIQVRRGMDSPYLTHPRLDLFLGSNSPHKVGMFACSSCHEGQGSATQFKWASHTPNDAEQRKDWSRKYGWFDNGHWIFPMYPRRFAESACLKCHHNVVELEPSERYPDPPAPKVTHGYHLLRKYGCYGCHEITGFDGPTRRVGPDMRLEPNFFAAAEEIKAQLQLTKSGDSTAYDQLSANEKGWLDTLIEHPEQDDVRHRLYEIFVTDEKTEKSDQRFTPERFAKLRRF